jgi:hypothetical protein
MRSFPSTILECGDDPWKQTEAVSRCIRSSSVGAPRLLPVLRYCKNIPRLFATNLWTTHHPSLLLLVGRAPLQIFPCWRCHDQARPRLESLREHHPPNICFIILLVSFPNTGQETICHPAGLWIRMSPLPPPQTMLRLWMLVRLSLFMTTTTTRRCHCTVTAAAATAVTKTTV